MSPPTDQCALDANGNLLDAEHITFFNDPDDPTPISVAKVPISTQVEGVGSVAKASEPVETQSRPQRARSGNHMAAILRAEKEDDDGNLISSRKQPKRKTKSARPVIVVDTDEDDENFDMGSESESDSGDDDEEDVVISNEELADALPSKTIPLTTGKAKRKATTAPSISTTAKKPRQHVTIGDFHDDANLNAARSLSDSTPLHEAAPPNPKPVQRTESTSSIASVPDLTTLLDGKKKFIYLFFEPVKADEYGITEPDFKYYRCHHGNRRIFRMSKQSKYNTKNMVAHLQSRFPPMYQLLRSLETRGTPPSPYEIMIATGSKDISEEDVKTHMKTLQIAAATSIKASFDKQTAAQWDQSKFQNLLAEFIVSSDQPFTLVEEPAFRRLLDYVHMFSRKGLDIPGRTTIRKRIMKMGEDSVESIKEMFCLLDSRVAISLDAWTSSNQLAFLAIVSHYVAKDGVYEELLIDFKELIGEHSGENMAKVVWGTLEVYGLTDKIIAFMMDNASNNDTLIKDIERRCTEAGILFSAKDARGRCMPHTIQLAAIALLEESGAISATDAQRATSGNYQDLVSDAMDLDTEDEDDEAVSDTSEDGADVDAVNVSCIWKLRKIVRAVRSSPQRRQAWARCIQTVYPAGVDDTGKDVKILMLTLDCKTRWGSTHDMLKRGIKFETATDHFVITHKELHRYLLDDDDWMNIKRIAEWLELFRAATIQMSATQSPMLSTTHAIFRGLQDQLKGILRSLPANVDPGIKNGVLKAHRKLSDYFYKVDESPYPLWASLLDPRISYNDLKMDYSDDEDLVQALEQSRNDLEAHFLHHYAHRVIRTTPAHVTVATASSSSRSSGSFDFTARFRREEQPFSLNEFEEFFWLPAQDFHSCDPLLWWHSNRIQFPNLYRLARDIFAIPGSAVAVERIFSGGRDTISLRRASLNADTIRTLMILKHHLRLRHKKSDKP